MRSFFYIMRLGWQELLRILQKHLGRNGAHTENNMTVVFWVCVITLVLGLAISIPWQVLAVSAMVMALLLLVLAWSIRK